MLKRDWTRTTSDFINYNTLNSGHDLIFHSRNQETCTANNHNEIRRRSDFCCEFCWCFVVALILQPQVALCKSERQKLENTEIGDWRAPTYLRRREEAAAAGRDSPPDLAVVVDNERQQTAAALKRAVAMAERGRRRAVALAESCVAMAGGGRRRRKVGFLHSIVASQVPVRNIQNLERESPNIWVSSPQGTYPNGRFGTQVSNIYFDY